MTRSVRIGLILTLLVAPALVRAQDVVPREYAGPLTTQPTPPPPDPQTFVPLPADMTTYEPPAPPPPGPPAAAGPGDDLGFGSFLGMGSAVPKASYGIRYLPEADVHGQPSSLGWVSQDFSASTPIWVGDKSVLSLNAGVRNQAFEGSAFFPATGTAVPDSLWNVRFGLAYNQTFANDWTMGLSAHVVSASDQPFGSLDEVKVGMMGTLRIPFREHDAWILSLTYSPTSQLPFPIPGVAYQWVPSPQFQMLIGLPTAIIYRPSEDLSFSLVWIPITNVRARATYRLMPCVRFYLGYEASNDSYYLADRTDNQERLNEYDQRVTMGVQWTPAKCFSADVFAGYSFDRYFFLGRNLSDRSANHFDLSDVPFIGAQATYRW